jgi:hypothetical protein
LNRSLNTWS